jgi:hypothetical protein
MYELPSISISQIPGERREFISITLDSQFAQWGRWEVCLPLCEELGYELGFWDRFKLYAVLLGGRGSRTVRRMDKLRRRYLDFAILPVTPEDAAELDFPDGSPQLNVLYMRHHLRDRTYLPVAHHNSYLLQEKFAELMRILASLDATTINISAREYQSSRIDNSSSTRVNFSAILGDIADASVIDSSTHETGDWGKFTISGSPPRNQQHVIRSGTTDMASTRANTEGGGTSTHRTLCRTISLRLQLQSPFRHNFRICFTCNHFGIRYWGQPSRKWQKLGGRSEVLSARAIADVGQLAFARPAPASQNYPEIQQRVPYPNI